MHTEDDERIFWGDRLSDQDAARRPPGLLRGSHWATTTAQCTTTTSDRLRFSTLGGARGCAGARRQRLQHAAAIAAAGSENSKWTSLKISCLCQRTTITETLPAFVLQRVGARPGGSDCIRPLQAADRGARRTRRWRQEELWKWRWNCRSEGKEREGVGSPEKRDIWFQEFRRAK